MSTHLTYKDDSELWHAFKQGDMEAFEQIYRSHFSMLLAYGKRISSDLEMVEDAIQDVYVELWKRRENLKSLHTIKFYLFRVLRNRLYALRQSSLVQEDDEFSEDVTNLFFIPAFEASVIEEESSRHRQLRLQKAISELPGRQREAVLLAFYDDFSTEEIAGIMGINQQSVNNHLNRAYTSLRRVLTDSVLPLILFLLFC
ncbi:RNA polymerase sigma factor [Siphonobacter aquaeclarae]|uniref:RNA polymerase, sigma subunit, ECF family n=1 Tax=Siphonobacter aquaeclarae TaxID=563176 RepID=A0A1G9V3Q6_9BACT|nr:sigma-70 family RNA polymerase sigma factor [Siphonobacter aquaeclarae]SDM66851.1 RNA polymerase, sigma subunit, ECF family [Siphonobacter aquaeclarae]